MLKPLNNLSIIDRILTLLNLPFVTESSRIERRDSTTIGGFRSLRIDLSTQIVLMFMEVLINL